MESMSTYRRDYGDNRGAFGSRYSNVSESSSRNRHVGWDADGVNFKVGQFYDVQDHKRQWYEAEVKEIVYAPTDASQVELIKFHFLFWADKHDEFYEPESSKIAPHMSHIYLPGTELLQSHRIDVLDVSLRHTKWLPATVVETTRDEIKVHYANYARSYDEWVKRDSGRIMPYGHKSKFKSDDFQKVMEFHYSPSKEKAHGAMSLEQHDMFVQQLAALEGGLSICKAAADGNCLFRSVSHQLYGTEEHHDLIRSKCVEYMELMGSFFENFFFVEKETYFENMRKDGVWGGEPEIQALLELYDRPVAIYVYDVVAKVKRITRGVEVGSRGESEGIVRLSYEGGNHYNSIVEASHGDHLLDSRRAGDVENRKLEHVQDLIEQEKQAAVTAGGDGEGEGKKDDEPAETEREERTLGRRLSAVRKDVKFDSIRNELNWGEVAPDDDPDLQAALAASMSPSNSLEREGLGTGSRDARLEQALVDSRNYAQKNADYDEDEALQRAIAESQMMVGMSKEEIELQQALEESRKMAEASKPRKRFV